jgi:hypothetical protein
MFRMLFFTVGTLHVSRLRCRYALSAPAASESEPRRRRRAIAAAPPRPHRAVRAAASLVATSSARIIACRLRRHCTLRRRRWRFGCTVSSPRRGAVAPRSEQCAQARREHRSHTRSEQHHEREGERREGRSEAHAAGGLADARQPCPVEGGGARAERHLRDELGGAQQPAGRAAASAHTNGDVQQSDGERTEQVLGKEVCDAVLVG